MTPEEKDLIVRAAEAAHIYLDWDAPNPPVARDGDNWNPLSDDGDCARLEAELSINVKYLDGGVECRAAMHPQIPPMFANCNSSTRPIARRFASVTLAARIGQEN